jgi:hypothetical protein
MPSKSNKTNKSAPTRTQKIAKKGRGHKTGRGSLLTGQAGKAASALRKRQKMLDNI